MSVCLPAHKRLSLMSLTRPAGQSCLDCVFKMVRQACWDLSIWCNLYQADACFQHRPPGWRSFLEHVQKTSQNISYLHYLFSVKSTVFSLLAPWRGELDMPEEVSFYLSWYIDHFSTHLSPVALQDNFSLLTTAVAWEWGAGRLAVLRGGDKDSGGCDSRCSVIKLLIENRKLGSVHASVLFPPHAAKKIKTNSSLNKNFQPLAKIASEWPDIPAL